MVLMSEGFGGDPRLVAYMQGEADIGKNRGALDRKLSHGTLPLRS
jgi:hypothetical protein